MLTRQMFCWISNILSPSLFWALQRKGGWYLGHQGHQGLVFQISHKKIMRLGENHVNATQHRINAVIPEGSLGRTCPIPKGQNLPVTGKGTQGPQGKLLVATRRGSLKESWQSQAVWRAKAVGGRLCGIFTTCSRWMVYYNWGKVSNTYIHTSGFLGLGWWSKRAVSSFCTFYDDQILFAKHSAPWMKM